MFLRALSRGNPNVLGLLTDNSNFQKKPIKMRIALYYYNFSNPKEQKNGFWWIKEPLEQFSLDINLKDNDEM